MGTNAWNPDDWATRSSSTQSKTQQQIFTSRGLHPDLDPLRITVRESVDSAAHPATTPIIIAVDETGSMGMLATEIIKNGLGVIMNNILDRKPVSDPHLMCMAIGDSKNNEQAPLQVTQFEADTVIADQIAKFFIEGNGGGNGGESYILAWYFAAKKTRCDAQIKRGKKGFLFTIGDEPPHLTLTSSEIKRYIGDDVEADISAKDLLDLVSQNWEVFHLIVKPGTYDKSRWVDLLGERAITVSDHSKLGEIIVSTLQVLQGDDLATVANSWDGSTALVIADSLKGLTKTGDSAGGVVTL